jgi:hypothetical protein
MRGQMIDEATRKGMDMFNRPIETEQAPPAQAVALAEPAAPPAVAAPADPITALIIRAATDPAFDAGKFKMLMDMQTDREARQAKAAYDAALSVMKPKLPSIKRNGRIEIPGKENKKGQSTPYALWEDIDEAITPILGEHGFALSFRTGLAQDGKITVTGVLTHSANGLSHREETTITLPHDSTGSKNAVQAVGSSFSYGKRYTATALLNIRTEGEDDDGHAAGTKLISDEQREALADMIARGWPDDPGYAERFCLHLSKLGKCEIRALKDIPAKLFDDAVVTLNTATRKRSQAK